MKYVIPYNYSGRDLQSLLRKELGISKRMLRILKLNKGILLNGKSVPPKNISVKEGDLLELKLDKCETRDLTEPQDIPINVIYEDKYMIVVDKDPHIVVHPTYNYPNGTLANGISYYAKSKGEKYPIRYVNRLDRGTSGLIIIGKNRYYCYQLQKAPMDKNYIALVWGELSSKEGVMDMPIRRKEDSFIEREVGDGGKRAITKYKVLEYLGDMTLLELDLITGRTHQIRVHLKTLGHPVVGDTIYGPDTDLISRPALHSYKLHFYHPLKKEFLKFTAPIHKDMKDLISKVK
ncbi:MAG TPA: RluA family pseudouridine synthase [Thermoanaerobacterales bacterium]|nr:RluA family pseudouridine synthase [Thermoanaerobacterales bacterium]